MQAIEYSQRTATGLRPILGDLYRGILNYRIWWAFAVEEIKNRYRRSAFGLIWIVLAFILLVFALVVFFGARSNQGRELTVYVSLGLVAYQFLMSSLTDSCTVFVRSATWIKSMRLPYSTYIYSAITKGMLPLLIQLVTAFFICYLVGWRPTWLALWTIPALFVILINTIWVYLFLGVVAARFRDIQHFIGSMGRFLFFMTPVFWKYETQSSFVVQVANFNPLTHYLEIFRRPLLGELPTMLNLTYVAVLTVVGWILALAVASRFKRRVPFWIG